MRYLGNAMQRRFSISAPGSVYNARWEPNLPTVLNMKLPAAETDYWSDFPKLVELTMQTIEETIFALKNKRKKMLQAINQNPFNNTWQ
jgi:hypothetical protein